MGCVGSSNVNEERPQVRNPRSWRSKERMTRSELREKRELFWKNAPSACGGRPAIWEALEDAAACDDLWYKQRILDMHNIRLGSPPDMTECFDENNFRYVLPLYVLREPANLY